MYRLKSIKAYFGTSNYPVTVLADAGDDRASIPVQIESQNDLDFEAIAEELAISLYPKTVEQWGFGITETTQEKADELNAEIAKSVLNGRVPLIKANVLVIGNGVTLLWEKEEAA